jgi:hypothetical protein
VIGAAVGVATRYGRGQGTKSEPLASPVPLPPRRRGVRWAARRAPVFIGEAMPPFAKPLGDGTLIPRSDVLTCVAPNGAEHSNFNGVRLLRQRCLSIPCGPASATRKPLKKPWPLRRNQRIGNGRSSQAPPRLQPSRKARGGQVGSRTHTRGTGEDRYSSIAFSLQWASKR